jgi:tight adherence protein B
VSILAALCVGAASAAAALVLTVRVGSADATRGGLRGMRRPRARRVPTVQWLRQAGSELTTLQFGLVSVGVGETNFALLALATRTPLVAVAPGVAAAAVPRAVLAHRRSLRFRQWQAAWPDALRELVAAIVSGRSFTQGVRALGESGPEPLREFFAEFATAARLLGTTAALEQIRDRMADPTSDRVIEVLLVAHERGGAIVRDVLEDLVSATSKDVKVLEEIDTEGLEMRINARAVLALPWLVLVALTLRPGPFREFYRSSGGLLVVCIAGLLSVLGTLWLMRLGRLPDEPRVFARTSGLAGSGQAR